VVEVSKNFGIASDLNIKLYVCLSRGVATTYDTWIKKIIMTEVSNNVIMTLALLIIILKRVNMCNVTIYNNDAIRMYSEGKGWVKTIDAYTRTEQTTAPIFVTEFFTKAIKNSI
jgi:hypothetical protein